MVDGGHRKKPQASQFLNQWISDFHVLENHLGKEVLKIQIFRPHRCIPRQPQRSIRFTSRANGVTLDWIYASIPLNLGELPFLVPSSENTLNVSSEVA